MWIFLSDAFLSIVDHRTKPGVLLVRARLRGDLERVFPGARVERTPAADYLYRAEVPRERVASVIADAIRAVDYPNFKGSVREPDRLRACHDVWHVMFDLQAERDRAEVEGPALQGGQRWRVPKGRKEARVLSVQDDLESDPVATLHYPASGRLFRLPLETAQRWLRHATPLRS
jgi:hypothetical protein